MTDLFSRESADLAYRALTDLSETRNDDVREMLVKLYSETALYLDCDLPNRFALQLQQAFWEMYVCAAFLRAELPVANQHERRWRRKGPDLQVGVDKELWCEAIAVTAGTGPDAVEETPTETVREIPHEKIKLRLTSGLLEKVAKYEGYLRQGLITDDEPRVIAINAGAVPSSHLELDIPRIVSVLLPFGWPSVEVDRETGEFGQWSWTHEAAIRKKSGASVSTAWFEDDRFTTVSAVVYSGVNPWNLGFPFVVVHNPRAIVPLPQPWLPFGQELWVADEGLCQQWHGPFMP